MREVLYSPLADDDLADILAYISADNEDAAHKLIDGIEEQCIAISQSPGMGRDRSSDTRDGLRSFPFRNCMVFYRVFPNHIEIVRVLHGAGDIPSVVRGGPSRKR
jgi:toxin ParE1/3/4